MKNLLKKEWLLAVRHRVEIWQPIAFVLLFLVLFPLAMGGDKTLLPRIAPATVWISVLLAVLLASDGYFRSDYEDGSLAQLLIAHYPMHQLIMAKLMVQWFALIFPILLSTPLIAFLYQLKLSSTWQLVLTLLLGSPSLMLLGMLGAAITLSVKRAGILLMLIILPLYLPILIFALAALSAHSEGFSNLGELALLGMMLCFSSVICPIATIAALRQTVQ